MMRGMTFWNMFLCFSDSELGSRWRVPPHLPCKKQKEQKQMKVLILLIGKLWKRKRSSPCPLPKGLGPGTSVVHSPLPKAASGKGSQVRSDEFYPFSVSPLQRACKKTPPLPPQPWSWASRAKTEFILQFHAGIVGQVQLHFRQHSIPSLQHSAGQRMEEMQATIIQVITPTTNRQ